MSEIPSQLLQQKTGNGLVHDLTLLVDRVLPSLCSSLISDHFWKQSEKESLVSDIVLLAKPVTLTEGDRVTLTTDVPVATDGTSKPEKLLYAVSLPPVRGQIEHINYPGVPISSYRQLDVVAQKVSHVHDNSHGAGKESLSGHKRHTTELAGFFNLLNGGSGGGVVEILSSKCWENRALESHVEERLVTQTLWVPTLIVCIETFSGQTTATLFQKKWPGPGGLLEKSHFGEDSPKLVKMALAYWAARDPSDFEEGKSSSAEALDPPFSSSYSNLFKEIEDCYG
ncbi:fras1-related hypothetical protein [Limosa lapponica baueri]|uniref:Uncharacterized protein n=1 Tax=Limosa lapponica baueri TaxID=1758121 RepID=A0A2I0TNW8_LIMLA|nr:fras1-related hypothetical protein [Limosa lapponica baueri]